jgi:hypothetical protein
MFRYGEEWLESGEEGDELWREICFRILDENSRSECRIRPNVGFRVPQTPGDDLEQWLWQCEFTSQWEGIAYLGELGNSTFQAYNDLA